MHEDSILVIKLRGHAYITNLKKVVRIRFVNHFPKRSDATIPDLIWLIEQFDEITLL